MKKPLIILTGPTAVGKTSLSVSLAKAIDGEIISADSMQVYRHMDIGSAKITREEMDGVPHHLIDILDPNEEFNVNRFQILAKEALEKIWERGHTPIVAGGTGFYIQALLYDIDFAKTEDDGTIRKELEELAAKEGLEYMHRLLSEIDSEAAKAIHANNGKRVIRAIEYFRQTGNKISEHNEKERAKESPYDFYYYVLNTDRSLLYERIDRRVDLMMEEGLLSEVQNLKNMGYSRDLVSMQGLGYKEILAFLEDQITLDEAVYTIKRDTRHFAKRQLTWFKRERDVRWLYLPDFENNPDHVLRYMLDDMKGYRK